MSEVTETNPSGEQQQTPPTSDADGETKDEVVTIKQSELNALISERLKRSEKSLAEKKYANYDTYKKAAEQLKALQDAQKTAEQKNTEALDALKTEKARIEQELSTLKLSDTRTKVAVEVGLPVEWINRLQGADEEEIREDAKKLLKILGSKAPRNIGSPPPAGKEQPLGENYAFNQAVIRAAKRGL